MNSLLLHEIHHGLIALPFAFFLWTKTKSYRLLLFLMLTAYFLDLDHLIDFWIYKGYLSTDVYDFFGLSYYTEMGKATVYFHGWEYVLILVFFVRKYGWKSYFAPLMLGMLPHLILDSFNVMNFQFYSIIYRVMTDFRLP